MSYVPTQGWKQFQVAKREMLVAYENAKTRASARPVKTDHGVVAESEFRRWLTSFLPRRYGVCSGYVVSQAMSEGEPLYHYDVIVYDQIESPVLWVEADEDRSSQGKRRAIPAEYVCAVLEVKAALTPSTAGEALRKLGELEPLLESVDTPDERYPIFLPTNFCCGAVFFEARKEDQYRQSSLDNLIGLMRGYFGGVVLTAEGTDGVNTGQIRLLQSETAIEGTIAPDKSSLLTGMSLGNSINIEDKCFISSMLGWSSMGFSQFAFDLLAMMQARYDPLRLSSWHGMPISRGKRRDIDPPAVAK